MMVAVESDAILEIDYDPAGGLLYVRFTDGDWYRYFEVPECLYRAFLAAESHGRFFHDRVRDRFAYRKGR